MQIKEENGDYICLKHNQIIKMVVIDDNVPPCDQLLCLTCLELNRSPYKIIGVGQAKEMIKEAFNKQNEGSQERMIEQLNQLKNVKKRVEELRSSILSTIDAINRLVESWTTDLTNSFNKDFSIDLLKGLDYLKSGKGETNDQLKTNEQFYLIKILSAFKKVLKMDGFQQFHKEVSKLIINQRCGKIDKEVKFGEEYNGSEQQYQIQPSYQRLIDRPINYIELEQFQVKQLNICYCLCFNKQNNILAVGCGSDIKIFQFENGNLTEIQLLKGHTLAVNCLYITLNNEIFSCSQDYTVKRWVYENNQWILAEEFKEHSSSIMCMVMNRTEEAFFTSSFDKTIKYWIKIQNKWRCIQTFGKMSFSLSLNQSQNLLLSNELMIYKQDRKSQWALIETLQSEEFGFRASFIGENMIAHQICNKGILRFYENSQKNPEFIVKIEIKVQDGECLFFFPQIYCTQLGILINKHNKFINIIKIKKDSKIQVEQAIEFQTTQIYGTLTEDGKYLVTYDGNQKQFAIRKLL